MKNTRCAVASIRYGSWGNLRPYSSVRYATLVTHQSRLCAGFGPSSRIWRWLRPFSHAVGGPKHACQIAHIPQCDEYAGDCTGCCKSQEMIIAIDETIIW